MNNKAFEEFHLNGSQRPPPSVVVDVPDGITFTWSKLSVSTKSTSGRRCCGLVRGTPTPGREILNSVSGQARPGQLLAIMGASGAGKTTLLNTFLFRNLSGLEVSGVRLANGVTVSPSSLIKLSGYVQQEDLFIGSLTVREHLVFQARVRMDRELNRDQRLNRVEEVIKELGLSEAAETMVGIPGRIKGISGGEMKRLSFASEVLTNPALMFCDEPTSGLDSFMAQSVMELLRGLARQGKTVICTIHQPSSQVFSTFDRLLLLAEGKTAFLGEASQAKTFFSSCHQPCPPDYNPADHLVQVLAVVPGQEEESRTRIAEIVHQFEESPEGKEMMDQVRREEAAVEEDGGGAESPYKASWGEQFAALAWRNWLGTVKDPMVAKVRIIQAFVIAIILGVIYLGQELDQPGIQNMNGALFVLITNISFGNIFSVVNVFCFELPVFLREHFNGMYRTDTYFLAKQVVDLPLFVVEPLIVVTILYWMVGLNPAPQQFFTACIIVLLVVQVVLSLGYFLSCIAPSIDIALAIAPVIIIPFMLFGGFYLNNSSVPVWLEWLKYLSWFLYGFEALMINQWEGTESIGCPQTLPDNQTLPCLDSGAQVLATLGFKVENFWLDIGMLLVLLLVYRTMAFLALLMKTRQKK